MANITLQDVYLSLSSTGAGRAPISGNPVIGTSYFIISEYTAGTTDSVIIANDVLTSSISGATFTQTLGTGMGGSSLTSPNNSGYHARFFRYQGSSTFDGTATITSTITTTNDGTATRSRDYTLPNNNTPPTATLNGGNNLVGNAGTSPSISVVVSDAETSNSNISWTLSTPGSDSSGITGDGNFTFTTIELRDVGTHTWTLVATDEGGLTATSTIQVTINVAPVQPSSPTVTNQSGAINIPGTTQVTFTATSTGIPTPTLSATSSQSYATVTEVSESGGVANYSVDFTTNTGAARSTVITLTGSSTAGSRSSQLTITQPANRAPGIITVATPANVAFTGGTSAALNPSAIDPDGDAVSYSYSGGGNGSVNTSNGAVTFGATNVRSTRFVTVTVLASSTGGSSSTTVNVTQNGDAAPTVSVSVPGTATVGSAINISATPANHTGFAWSRSGVAGTFGNSGSTSTTFTPTAAGAYTLTATASDALGSTTASGSGTAGSGTSGLSLTLPSPPDTFQTVAVTYGFSGITFGRTYRLRTGSSTSFAASTVVSGSTLDPSVTASNSINFTRSTPQTVYFFVEELLFGNSFSSIGPNGLTWSDVIPSVSINQNPGNTNENQNQVFTAVPVNDANGTATWSISGNGTISGSGNSITVVPTDVGPGGGSYTITATVVSSTNNSATASRVVTVNFVNRTPTVSINQGANITVAQRSSTTLTATRSDPDGQSTTLVWSKTSGAGSVNSSTGVYTAPTGYVHSAQSAVIRATVSDGSLSASDQITVTIPLYTNVAPTLTSVTNNSGGNVASGTVVRFTANGGSDSPDGSVSTYRFQIGSTVVQNNSSNLYDFTTSNTGTANANTTVTCAAVDDDGASSPTRSSTVTVIPVPRNPTGNIQPTTPVNENTSRLYSISSPVNVQSRSWSVTGGGTFSGSSTGTTFNVAANGVGPGGGSYVVNCRLTSITGQILDVTRTITVNFINQAPTITTAALANPSTVLSGGNTAMTVTASDPDGQAVSYTWRLGSTVLSTAQNFTYTPATTTAAHRDDTLIVTASDGSLTVVSQEVVRVVKQSTVSLVTSDTTPNERGSSTFTATVSNGTGTTTTSNGYSWSTPGGVIQGSTNLNAITVLWNEVTTNTARTVSVTATTSRNNPSTSIGVTVQQVNRPPNITSVANANPSTVASGGSTNLTVNATDADTEQTLSYVWRFGSTVISNAEDFTWTPAANTGTANRVDTVTVTVSDSVTSVTSSEDITITPTTTVPVAVLTLTGGFAGSAITADGSLSTHPGGTLNQYAFTVTGPGISTSQTGASSSFVISTSSAGTYTFTLQVRDTTDSPANPSAIVTQSIVIVAAPTGNLVSAGGYGIEIYDASGNLVQRYDENFMRLGAAPTMAITNVGSNATIAFTGDTSRVLVVPVATSTSNDAITLATQPPVTVVNGSGSATVTWGSSSSEYTQLAVFLL